MGSRAEGFFAGLNETKIFFQVWEPDQPARGLLVITHGQGEHSECYQRLVDAIAPLEWTVLAWDLRGHGRSEGQRGFAAHFLDYVRDFDLFTSQVLPQFKSQLPTVFLGHSMGALIQLKSFSEVLMGEDHNQILSSPFLGLTLEVPAYKDLAAGLLRRWAPQVTLDNEIDDRDLSRDPKVLEEYAKDTLRHRKISPEVYLGAQECQASVLSHAEIWTSPLLMLLAENDPVVSTPIARKFFEQLPDAKKSLFVFPRRKHELFNDLEREKVFVIVQDFLRRFNS